MGSCQNLYSIIRILTVKRVQNESSHTRTSSHPLILFCFPNIVSLTLFFDSKVKFHPSCNIKSQNLVFAARRLQRQITKNCLTKAFLVNDSKLTKYVNAIWINVQKA